jgi:hypothetical protein
MSWVKNRLDEMPTIQNQAVAAVLKGVRLPTFYLVNMNMTLVYLDEPYSKDSVKV